MEGTGRRLWTYIVDFIAVLVQVSILLLWPIYSYFERWPSFSSWLVPVSLVLVSLGHWENYINRYTRLGNWGNKLKELKKNTCRMRIKMYLFMSLWKIISTIVFMTCIVSGFRADCAKGLYFLSESRRAECSQLAHPHFRIKEDFNDPAWVMLVQAGTCLLCYTLAKTACKILLQIASFALPLTLSLPVLSGILLSDCYRPEGSSSQSHPYMPAYLNWNCELHGGSSDYLTTLLVKFYCPLWAVWWLSFVWITCHIWFPRAEKLAQTER